MERDNLNDYMTFKEFCRANSSIVSESGLRWILFNSKQNGADCFVRRLGRRKLLISPQRFFSWLERQKRGDAAYECR
jgi:hypothetical protein